MGEVKGEDFGEEGAIVNEELICEDIREVSADEFAAETFFFENIDGLGNDGIVDVKIAIMREDEIDCFFHLCFVIL